ncbi:hypothetical protein ACFVXC_41375 [Streptomyces sp. NPDC058257]
MSDVCVAGSATGPATRVAGRGRGRAAGRKSADRGSAAFGPLALVSLAFT